MVSSQLKRLQKHIPPEVRSASEKLDQLLREEDLFAIKAYFVEMANMLRNSGVTVSVAKMVCYDIANTVYRYLERRYHSAQSTMVESPNVFIISSFDTIDDLLRILLRVSNGLIDQFERENGGEELPLHEKMVEYIKEHCSNCDFSVGQMADAFSMSPSNLSQYFKSRQGETVMEFVTQRMNHSMIKLGDTRKNIDAYPQRALFEGVINAVAHRDYFLDGTQIQVDMFKDRLEISSPGSFYRGEKIGKTYDLSGIISKRRNELITAVLVSCNVMEAAGTGFDKIVEEYKMADEMHRPYIYSSSDHFTLVLPDLTYMDGVEDNNLPVLNFVPVQSGTDYDDKVLSFCYYRAHKVSEIAEHLGISDSTYLRKQVLGNLEMQGYLEKSKIARAMYFKTNRDAVTVD